MEKLGLYDFLAERGRTTVTQTEEEMLEDKEVWMARAGITDEDLELVGEIMLAMIVQVLVTNPTLAITVVLSMGVQYGYLLREQHEEAEAYALEELLGGE